MFHRKNTKKSREGRRKRIVQAKKSIEKRRKRRVQANLELTMALDYPSCSFWVNDECSAAMKRGYGCWSEESSPLSSLGVNSNWWDDLDLEPQPEPEPEEEVDPVECLPVDPFEMETELKAALASCIVDLTVMSAAGCYGSSDGGANVCADLSFFLVNQAIAYSRGPLAAGACRSAFEWPFEFGGLSDAGGANCSQGLPPVASCSQSTILPGQEPSFERPFEFGGLSDARGANCSQGLPPVASYSQSTILPGQEPSTSGNAALACPDGVSAPHDGMLYALAYLGLRDILAAEMVCKTLHSAIRNDPLLWKCVHVEPVLSGKIFDRDLLRLTQKIPGGLHCLNINDCINITDNGLNAVLQSNPGLTKLSIARCPRLTLDGLIANLKSFNTKAVFGIKSLRIDKNFNLPKEDYEELLSLLSIDKRQELHNRAPRFRHSSHFLLDCNDGFALDIEMCPICESYKLVFDCPEVGCSDKRSGKCRACEVCIKRCLQCGRCLERNEKFEEKFDLVYLCYKCRGDSASSLTVEKDLFSILPGGGIPSP